MQALGSHAGADTLTSDCRAKDPADPEGSLPLPESRPESQTQNSSHLPLPSPPKARSKSCLPRDIWASLESARQQQGTPGTVATAFPRFPLLVPELSSRHCVVHCPHRLRLTEDASITGVSKHDLLGVPVLPCDDCSTRDKIAHFLLLSCLL